MRKWLIIKDQFGDCESDNEVESEDNRFSFYYQLTIEYLDFDIDYFVSKRDEMFYAFINCPDNRIRCQQGKLEHYELLHFFVHQLEDNHEIQYPGYNCNEFCDTFYKEKNPNLRCFF